MSPRHTATHGHDGRRFHSPVVDLDLLCTMVTDTFAADCSGLSAEWLPINETIPTDNAMHPDKGAPDGKRVIDGRGSTNQSTNHKLRTLAASLTVPC